MKRNVITLHLIGFQKVEGQAMTHIAFNRISKSGRSGYDMGVLLTDILLHGTVINQVTFDRISKIK